MEDNQEEKLEKRKVKLFEEMYVERDWTDGRFYDEALESIIREERILTNF